MERTRLRELTQLEQRFTDAVILCVEMERTRLRELTQYFIVRPPFVFFVEMERTRLRELTPVIVCSCSAMRSP